jgi:hypothetical protein
MPLAYFILFSNICIVDITANLLFLNKSKPNFMKTLIKPSELNVRFVIIVILLFTVFALIGLFAGCGNDDNPTGNNNPPVVNNDSLLFSVDSFTVYSNVLPHSQSFQFNDTTRLNRKYKVVCTAVSNVPVTNDTAYIKYICLPYPNGNIVWLESRNNELTNYHLEHTFEQDSTFNYSVIKHYFSTGFSSAYPTTFNHYITVKKFQLFVLD